MKCSSFKHSGSETKILPLGDTRVASVLRCEVIGGYKRGELPSLLSIIGLTTGPHPLATVVIKP
jgi:hypothetical protein